MTGYEIGLWALLLVTLVLAALAASAETSLTSVNRIGLRRLVEESNPRALVIQKLYQEPNDYLTATLTVNTLVIVISATAADLIAETHGLHGFWPQLAVSVVDALVVLVLCEVTAKTLALGNMRYALWIAPRVTIDHHHFASTRSRDVGVCAASVPGAGQGERPVRDRGGAEDAGHRRRGGGDHRGGGAGDDPRRHRDRRHDRPRGDDPAHRHRRGRGQPPG